MRMLTDLIDLPRRTASLALAALLGSTVSVPAGAASQASDAPGGVRLQMLLRDGRWIDGQVDRIGIDRFSLTRASTATDPAAGEIKSDEVVACLVGPDAYRSMAFLTQMSAGTLVFGDGQLLPGTLRPDLRQPRWEHRWIGAVPIKTDLISELRLVATRRAPARPDSDSVLLQNGDVVRHPRSRPPFKAEPMRRQRHPLSGASISIESPPSRSPPLNNLGPQMRFSGPPMERSFARRVSRSTPSPDGGSSSRIRILLRRATQSRSQARWHGQRRSSSTGRR
jgi:hypothetical protein